MCGLFGFWLKKKLKHRDIAFGKSCLDMISHRGPDNKSSWYVKEQGLFLGHTRLSIIDKSKKSDQPFIYKNFVMIFNGEIYNFLELKDKLLKLGHIFKTSSDTEVLIHAWEEWKEKCLELFDGMFVFVIYDGRSLTVVSDLFGEKPLYILENENGIYFCSEPHALIKNLGLKFKIDEKELIYFCAFGFFPNQNTGFKYLKRMKQSTIYKLLSPTQKYEKKYWTPPVRFIGKGKIAKFHASEIKEVKDILTESLSLRLRSDVSLGLFLSSGMDSSLVAALSSKELNHKLLTLSVKYSNQFDESNKANRIAKFLKLENIIIDNSKIQYRNNISKLVNLYGVPIDNISAISVKDMSDSAKKYITVALSGLGGDELILGYNKYFFLDKFKLLYRIPGSFWSLFNSFANNFRIKKFNYFSGSNLERFVRLKNSNELAESVMEFFEPQENINFFLNEAKLLDAVLKFDLNFTLPCNYIPAIERASMKSSIEVRTPFLSKKLYERVSQIDYRKFFKNGQKELFRLILKDYLPNELISKSKRGFVVPESNTKLEHSFDAIKRGVKSKIFFKRFDKTLLRRIKILDKFYSYN